MVLNKSVLCAYPQDGRIIFASSPGGKARAKAAVSFPLPVGKPAVEVAAALKLFLAENNLHAKRAVVALPSRNVTVLKRNVPSRAADDVREIVRLEAPSYFSLPEDELLCDYRSTAGFGNSSDVTVFGCRKKNTSAVTDLLQAAGLMVAAVMPGAYSFFQCLSANTEQGLFFLESDGVLDCCVVKDGVIVLTRTCPVLAEDKRGSIRQGLTAFLAQAAGLVDDDAGITLHRYTDSLTQQMISEVAANFMNAKAAIAEEEAEDHDGLPAVVIAEEYAKRRAAFVDLLHSSLLVTHKHVSGSHLRTSIIALVAAVLIGGGMYGYYAMQQRQVTDLQSQMTLIQKNASRAESAKTVLDAAAPWRERRINYLDLLAEISEAFPDQDGIWIDSLNSKEGEKTIITGKADSSTKSILFLDALKKSSSFKDVTLLYSRAGTGTSKESSFSIRFNYTKGGAR